MEKRRVSIFLRSLILRGLRWGRFRAGVWVIPLTSIRDDIQVCSNGCRANAWGPLAGSSMEP